MKRTKIALMTLVLMCSIFSLNTQAQEAQSQQRQRPQSQNGQFRGMMRSSSLEGIWQGCSISDNKGEVKVQPLPTMKIISAMNTYQDILVQTSGEGSVVTESGMYRPGTDSTYTRQIFASIDSTESAKFSKTLKITKQGRKWLVITYTSVDGKETSQELWMKIGSTMPPRNSFSWGNRGGGNNPQASESNGQRRNRNRAPQQNNAFQDEMNQAVKDMGNDDF